MTPSFRLCLASSYLYFAIALGAQTSPAKSAATAPFEGANAIHLAVIPEQARAGQPDLTKTPTLFVVGYAHLDTEWRWDYPQVINEYLAHTLHDNFDLIAEYPHYIFNFTGANRYMMFKEYYPADYAKLKQLVAQGRWYPGGGSMEENDVNSPNAESIIRQVLYGNGYFRQEFGKAGVDYMLPDCFGFPASLPSVLSHAGIVGFSTQKLSAGWQPAAHVGGPGSPENTPEGIPFNVGIWTGPDGKSVIAATNPGSYDSNVATDLSKNPLTNLNYDRNSLNPVDEDGKVTGIYSDYHYVGTGDVGGSPQPDSVKIMEAIVTRGDAVLPLPGRGRGGRGGLGSDGQPLLPPLPNPAVQVGDGPIHVMWSNSDDMFLDMKDMDLSRLPKYSGDLELINHSAGSISSQAAHKRWNRKNEILAGAAEAASVGAAWLGSRTYPQDRINYAWRLILGGQFHDIMAGTADPGAYTYSWNDDTIAANQLASVFTSATGAIAAHMNTSGSGSAIVVFNPLNVARQDLVQVATDRSSGAVEVIGPDGAPVPAQLETDAAGKPTLVFLARVPSLGYAVYHEVTDHSSATSTLKVNGHGLENARYRIGINDVGDVSSIFDKRLNRELLSGPMRLSFQSERPSQWPAWNMDWKDQLAPPRAYVSGPAKIHVVENGPARVAVVIERSAEGSHFVQTVRLSAGDAGNRVEFAASVDWKTGGSALMADFPLTAANSEATYNWDIGTIVRANDDPRKFEVPSHQWVDLTDRSGRFGATVLTDVKNASDKPDDNTIRLTLLYTPGLNPGGSGYPDQATQDWGHHDIEFGLAGHAGDWREGATDWQAYRLNEPLVAFASPSHEGDLGTSFSLLHIDNPRIRVLALKKAEASDEVVVRMVEINGQPETGVRVGFAAPVTAARETNGQEQALGAATVEAGELITSFAGYQPRTFAVKLAPPVARRTSPATQTVQLDFDAAVASNDGTATPQGSGMNAAGDAYPAEMLPSAIDLGGVGFKLAPAATGTKNAVTARGQTIQLPVGTYNRVYILAAADGDQKASFLVGNSSNELIIQDWTGFIGQWDSRSWKPLQYQTMGRGARGADGQPGPPQLVTRVAQVFASLASGYTKTAQLAWFASHHHNAQGTNVAYSYSYLSAYELPIPAGAATLTLPNNNRIHVLAVSVAAQTGQVTPAQPLYDVLPYALTAEQKALLYGPGEGPDVAAIEASGGRGGAQ